MKKSILIVFAVTLFLFSNSCSNDVDLNAPWQNIPVVYGLLSNEDVAQYFRVEKAFLDPTTSALDIAQRPDSLYYENATVRIERLNGDNVVDTHDLIRVDGNLEGFEREAGIFADTPNFLYKLSESETLVEGSPYRFVLERGDGLPSVTAETVLISEMEIVFPNDEADFKWSGPGVTQSVQWTFNKENAIFFDLSIEIHYRENSPSDPNTFIDKSITWPAQQNIENEEEANVVGFKFDVEELYRFLGKSLEANNQIERRLVNVDLVVDAGGAELFEYINVGGANTGITGSQIIPTYTNLSEGFGVFSSRGRTVSAGHKLLNAAKDSLVSGQYTQDLNFQ